MHLLHLTLEPPGAILTALYGSFSAPRQHEFVVARTGGVLELTEPFHYQPGDCTLHHGWCVHGGPDNTTPDPRWSYLFSYPPADTRYW